MDTYEVKRTDKEINDLLNECAEQEAKGGSRYRGMTYEQGIRNAIDWILGNMDDNPLDD